MNPREIYYLLGKCLVMDDFPGFKEEVSGLTGREDFPWEAFVSAGSNHLVLPALYYKFRTCGLPEVFPPELRDHLEGIFLLNQTRNKSILDQAVEINTELRNAGIRPVFIKGVASLFLGIYAHPAERMLWDIDCVIPGSQARDAVEILRKEGYTHRAYRDEDLPIMHHFPTLSRAGLPAPVDLHFRPVAGGFGSLLHGWEDRTVMAGDADGGPIETVDPADLALLNFLHSQVQDHGDYYARVSLKNLYEFYRLNRSRDPLSGIPLPKGGIYRKLENYRALAGRTFTPDPGRVMPGGIRTRLFLRRFDLNKSSRAYYLVSRSSRQLLFQSAYYLKLLSRAMVQKKYRRYVLVRMGDRAWPRSHFIHLRRRFGRAPNR